MTAFRAFVASLVMAAGLALSGTAGAYNLEAPNSFDIVSPGSADYREVYSFCEEGKAPGYTTDYFTQRKSMTRYELASVIKSILQSRGQFTFTPDEENNLRQLRQDYARELEALGWKDPKPKEVKPIFEFHGDARVRQSSGGRSDGRARVGMKWNIDDNTSAQAQGSGHMSF